MGMGVSVTFYPWVGHGFALPVPDPTHCHPYLHRHLLAEELRRHPLLPFDATAPGLGDGGVQARGAGTWVVLYQAGLRHDGPTC
uniref:Uncharacterized protein n=1 Tax=Oryza sativa subsp. japonica TaxID=39947 RepID=Q69XD6_ORYSJ|nr:hypothetical protein [Oryza sativa Japonica Group]